MEGDGLHAEGDFFFFSFLFGLCREQLENRVLETALVFLCSARENYEGGDVMILATVQTYFLLFRGGICMVCGHVYVFLHMMPFCLCENQST